MADFRITPPATTNTARIPAANNALPANNPEVGTDTALVADNNAAVANEHWDTMAGDDGLDTEGLDFDLNAGLAAMNTVPLGAPALNPPPPPPPLPPLAANNAPAANNFAANNAPAANAAANNLVANNAPAAKVADNKLQAAQALDRAAQAHLAAARADMAIGDTAGAARELNAAAKDLEREAELLMASPTSNQPGGGGTTAPTSPWTVKTAPLTEHNTFSSVGDPHETTGDGLKFDNQKTGNFTLLKSASGDFEVQNMQEKDTKGRWAGATLNKQVAIKDGNDVVFYDGKTGKLSVNGQETAMPTAGHPVRLAGGGRVEKTADGIKVITSKNDEVSVKQQDGYIDITGKLGNRKDGEVRGGLGSFDADADQGNDFKPRTGDAVMGNPKDPAVVDKFEEEWRVPQNQSLFPKAAQQPGGGGTVDPAAEAAAKAKDEADFAKADVNKDGILTGTETKGYEKYAKDTTFVGSDGKKHMVITKDEFMAARLAERAAQATEGAVTGDDKRLTERQAIAKDLKDFDKLDRNQDGNLTGKATYAKVKQYDANNDGKVTREEFLAGRAKERADARFKELDKDKDGKLGGAELKDKFKRYDTNGDGVVDAKEFQTGRLQDTAPLRDEAEFNRLDRTKDGFLTGQRTVKKWKKYDENNDGKISKEEFLKGRANERADAAFKALDKNRDTILSGTEVPKGADANNDEMVTEAEYRKWRESQEAARADERAFAELDRNHDGMLSGTQTYAGVKQYDANGDGVVSREEYLAGKAKEREDV